MMIDIGHPTHRLLPGAETSVVHCPSRTGGDRRRRVVHTAGCARTATGEDQRSPSRAAREAVVSRRSTIATALIVLGVVAVAVFGTVAAERAKGRLTPVASARVPGRVGVHLGAGEWDVLGLSGTERSIGGGGFSLHETQSGAPVVTAAHVLVTDPHGSEVAVVDRAGDESTETYTSGGRIYLRVASFSVSAPGTYTVSVTGVPASRVVVTAPVLSGLTVVAPWAGGAFLGLVCGAGGVIVLLVGAGRRRQPAAAGEPVPPGWFPDPSGRYQLRWWDGSAYTEHVSSGGVTGTDPPPR